jgi:hypothetical protein
METRRAILRRAGRGALGGVVALLAACSGPTRSVFPTVTATLPLPTATATPPPTAEPTREPPRPRPVGTIGSGLGVATPAGTPRVRPGFARAHLRVIHAAAILPALVIVVDSAELGTIRYPEASAYTDIPYGSRRIEGVTASGGVFALALDAGDGVAYTIVVASEGTTARAILITDDQPVPDAGTCRLRFIPLDAAAGPLDLAVAAGATLTTGVVPFSVGPSVAAPTGRYGLEVRSPDRAEPLLTKPPLALDAGDRYTAVLSGSAAAQSLRLILYPDAASG